MSRLFSADFEIDLSGWGDGMGYRNAIELAGDMWWAHHRGAKDSGMEQIVKWIRVEDRLPEKAEPILLVNHGRTVFGVFHPSGIFEEYYLMDGCVARRQAHDVSHWYPLPEPPSIGT